MNYQDSYHAPVSFSPTKDCAMSRISEVDRGQAEPKLEEGLGANFTL